MTKVTKKFPKEELQALVGYEECDLTIVENEIVDTSRWSNIYDLIFRDNATGKTYRTSYSTGATEYQDESPFEYDGDEVECVEVHEVEVLQKVWQVVTT